MTDVQRSDGQYVVLLFISIGAGSFLLRTLLWLSPSMRGLVTIGTFAIPLVVFPALLLAMREGCEKKRLKLAGAAGLFVWQASSLLGAFVYRYRTGMEIGCYIVVTPATLFVYLIYAALIGADRRHPTGQCDRCGYLLEGLVEARCPECGTPFSVKAESCDDPADE